MRWVCMLTPPLELCKKTALRETLWQGHPKQSCIASGPAPWISSRERRSRLHSLTTAPTAWDRPIVICHTGESDYLDKKKVFRTFCFLIICFRHALDARMIFKITWLLFCVHYSQFYPSCAQDIVHRTRPIPVHWPGLCHDKRGDERTQRPP